MLKKFIFCTGALALLTACSQASDAANSAADTASEKASQAASAVAQKAKDVVPDWRRARRYI